LPLRLDRPSRATVGRPTGVGWANTPAAAPALVAEAASAALDALAALERHARDVADAFRWRHVVQGRAGLTTLIEATQTLLQLGGSAAAASGTDLISMCRRFDARADLKTQCAADRLITAQLAGDWAALAGAIDHDFVGALEAWRDVFEALAAAAGDAGPGGWAA
jgi:hypothetical protein